MGLFLFLLTLWAAPATAVAAPVTPAFDPAREHFAEGQRLFQGGNPSQALVEYRLSHELSNNPEALFGMAQCEYHMGRLRDAYAHFQTYLANPNHAPDLTAFVQLRLTAIDARPTTFDITTVPTGVDVSFERLDGEGLAPHTTGQAPGKFEIGRGRYRLTLSHADFATQKHNVTVDVADAKTLFFKLEPTPARLEIRTYPPGATLYVRGNRARNPYIQDVQAGAYDLYAEATDHESGTDTVTVHAGEQRKVGLRLKYIQRSGRPELLWFWTTSGAILGGTGILARLNTRAGGESVTASATVISFGALVGGAAGALGATAYTPEYIRDNLALFRIGTMWMGAVQGACIGLAINQRLTSAWAGGALGLTAGAVAGRFLDDRAPNYGRVAIIQSAAAAGAVAGALVVPAFGGELNFGGDGHRAVAVLAGLNVGLATGLGLAYVPDQKVYGPTWRRVLLVDLAGATGIFAGALLETVGRCASSDGTCEFLARPRTSKLALLGGILGFGAGWALTRSYDQAQSREPTQGPTSLMIPMPTALPVVGPDGRMAIVPGLGSQGRF